jgi:NAD-dependent deacetylase sirtuin 2
VKPDITFFGEMLPDKFYSMHKEDFSACDLLIILGTSLKVAPFNNLPSLVDITVPRLLIIRDLVRGTGARPLVVEGPAWYRFESHGMGDRNKLSKIK